MASKLNVDKIARGSGTPEFTWPTADGTAGQAMVTNASGVLSFADAGPSLTGSTNTWIPTITGANALTGTANFTYDGNTLDVKNSGTASSINLYCETGNAHYIKLKSGPHASATSYTLTLPNAPPSTNGQHLAATTAGVASWADPPAGITQASQWRLTSAATGAQNPISANLEEVDTDSYTRIGSAMTESSGVFTFPVTGIWRIDGQFLFVIENTSSRFGGADVQVTTDNGSAWSMASTSNGSMYSSGASYANVYFTHQFDVTNVSTHKVRFTTWVDNGSTYINGSSTATMTGFTFTRLGDT